YFTHAQVEVLPQQQSITGYACIEGAGPMLLQQVASLLQKSPQLANLRTLRRFGPWLHSTTYHYFAIAFDQAQVRYDLDRYAIEIVNMPADYAFHYRAICGFPSPATQGAAH